ncbi:MAG: ribosome silencing factor [Candidatus Arsenophonus melophagi]|nr:ribosome silencing factor [Candidatus Arsenophonus melophagi]
MTGEHLQDNKLQQFIIDQLVDIKAKDIITIDVSRKSSITDFMIICTGTSNRHLTSIADKLIEACCMMKIIPLGVEGKGISDWIVVDLGDTIIHIMQEDSRRMYELEKLWS